MNLLIGVFVEAAKVTSEASLFSGVSSVRLSSPGTDLQSDEKQHVLEAYISKLQDRMQQLELSHQQAVSTIEDSLVSLQASQQSIETMLGKLVTAQTGTATIRDAQDEPAQSVCMS